MIYNNPHRKSRNIIIGLVVAEQLTRTLGSVFLLSKINKVLKISSPLKGGLRRSPKIPDRQLRKSAIVKLEALKRNRGINSVGRKDKLKLGNTFDNIIVENTTSKSSWVKMVR